MSVSATITNEAARVIALIAKKHPGAAVTIEWREGEPEMFWFATADDGAVSTTYVIDDESGRWAPLNAEELALYDTGKTVFREEPGQILHIEGVAATREP